MIACHLTNEALLQITYYIYVDLKTNSGPPPSPPQTCLAHGHVINRLLYACAGHFEMQV